MNVTSFRFPNGLVRLCMVTESNRLVELFLGGESFLDDVMSLTCEPNVRYASVTLLTNEGHKTTVVKANYNWIKVGNGP